MIIIKHISADEAYEIRRSILRDNIPLTEKMDGDFDETTFHLGAFSEDKLVCVATFMKHKNQFFDTSQYRLRGMATHIEYQYKGYGKVILEKAASILKEMNIKILWCNARVIALKFYKNCGFEVIGEEFDVHMIGPHYVMCKNLNND